jgi:acetyltransferase-like isoleucine patch superfamily enzyme
MAFCTKKQVEKIGFKSVGANVRISDKATFYNCSEIEIGSNSRIDDFCVISGKIKIGDNVHITPMCLVAGGTKGIIFENFTTIAYGVRVFTQSDDYSGATMTNSTIPKEYKNEFMQEVILKKHTIVGAGSTIMPGVVLEEGTSVGAMSLVLKSTDSWGVYVGSPAKRLRDRDKKLLTLEKKYFLNKSNNK